MSRGELVHDEDRFHTLCEGLHCTRGTLVTSPRCHRLSYSFLDFVDHNTAWFIGIPWAVTSCPCWAEPNWKGSRTRVTSLGFSIRYGMKISRYRYLFLLSRLCKISINCIAFFEIILHSFEFHNQSIDRSKRSCSRRIYALPTSIYVSHNASSLLIFAREQ